VVAGSHPLTATVAPQRLFVEALLRPYGQILFSKDLRTGLLVALAIATFPALAVATVAAILIAVLVSLLFGLGTESVRDGGPACTAVLATLALAVFAPEGGHPLVLVLLAAPLAVFLYASFESVFASVALPSHSLPFIATTWVVHLASRSLPAAASSMTLLQPTELLPGGWFAAGWWDLPASLLFLNGTVAGVAVLAAIALHSRIALLLALVGFTTALGMRELLRAEAVWSLVDVIASFNAVLTAMALGGVWFVPHLSSLVLAAGGAAAAVLLSYALAPAASMAYLPVLSLPFVVTTHLVLTASRRRLEDRRPRSTIPADRPEEALAAHLSRQRRFGDAAWLPFRLPFRGSWIVTQGHDGAHTHQGPWRHGLDFEGVDADGRRHRGEGRELRDYHCYGLPVVAAGAGTVAEVTDGIEDNVPGQINTRNRWGNAVVIAHGPFLHSVYAHLKTGTIRVKPGQVVGAGDELARCGSSGRSPVPHLHFQVQRAPTLGSPTLHADFGDVVTGSDGDEQLANLVVPAQDELVRPILPDKAIAQALAFVPGTAFELTDEEGGREEAAVEVDLLGRRRLRSTRATVLLEPYENGLVVVDYQGSPRSLLRVVLLALARVPFDQARILTWTEHLPARFLLPGWLRAAADLAAVVAPGAGNSVVRYRRERTSAALVVRAEGPNWSSSAALSLGGGSHEIELTHRGKTQKIRMRQLDRAPDSQREDRP